MPRRLDALMPLHTHASANVLVATNPPEALRMAFSSYGMFTAVAAAIDAEYVTVSTVALVIAADTGVAAAPTTAYCGSSPFVSTTGWLNVTVNTVSALVALTMVIGAVGCGATTPMFRRRFRFDFGARLIALGMTRLLRKVVENHGLKKNSKR